MTFTFVGGKGGVGKTTCAAMFALQASRTGATLLVTTDPASSLPAVLDSKVGGHPSAVPGAKGLFAANVDAAAAFDRWLAPRKALLATIAVRGTYLDEDDVGRLLKLSLPGIDEVIGLLDVMRMVEQSAVAYQQVIVDTAPTGHTLRLLASPALLGRIAALLDALQSHHRAVVSALRGAYRTDAADSLIVDLDREGNELVRLLRDPSSTALTWVTLPEPMALEETSDALAALERGGMAVRRLVVNRMTAPPPQPCAWCNARIRFEARALAPLLRRFPGRDIVAMPELSTEPRGVTALRSAAKRMAPWVARAPEDAPASRIRAIADGVDRQVASGFGRKIAGTRKILLFGGKGGVGKSTCAAATALQLAATSRVLLLSTDPAHSLGDVFGARLDNQPRQLPGGPRTLHVREIDAAAEMDRFRRNYVDAVDDAFARIARTAAADQEAFRELIDLAPPGIDEVIAIADVAEAVAGADRAYDTVVIDTAPTGHALRLLQTPAILRDWTLALMAILLKYREVVGAGALGALLVQLSKRLRALQDMLADRERSVFIVVTRAGVVPVEESLELIAALGPLGIAVGAIVVNAVGAGDCPRCRGNRRAQRTAIARLRRQRGGQPYTMIEAPAEVPPPHGVRRLLDWADAWRSLT